MMIAMADMDVAAGAGFGSSFNVLPPVFNVMPVPLLDGGPERCGSLPPALARKFAAIEPCGLILVAGLLAPGIPGQVVAPLMRVASALLFLIARA